eukprot:TRINITY_DN2929_c0_g1_i1.p1 TRINITY_DN2929_c0_g1~~TRINITY_DN2929_c0_g1_i1.p1  ORF type:complete len:183 (-),score=57.65 TRINITY_DN2929_c0_g1_i1:365-913(-)
MKQSRSPSRVTSKSVFLQSSSGGAFKEGEVQFFTKSALKTGRKRTGIELSTEPTRLRDKSVVSIPPASDALRLTGGLLGRIEKAIEKGPDIEELNVQLTPVSRQKRKKRRPSKAITPRRTSSPDIYLTPESTESPGSGRRTSPATRKKRKYMTKSSSTKRRLDFNRIDLSGIENNDIENDQQ